jgi:hypothetical protein
MKREDEQAKEPCLQAEQGSADRTQAWMGLTYDYLCDLLRQLDDVAGLLEVRDSAGIRHIAHRAKGTSGTFGLTSISEEFARLEQTATDRSRERIARLVVRIRQLVEAEAENLRPRVAPSCRGHTGGTDG